MSVKFLARERFSEFIASVTSGRDLYGHRKGDGEVPHLVRTDAENLHLGTARSVEPVKTVLFPPREDLGGYFAGEPEETAPPAALVGATACDLRALNVLDAVFLGGEFKDPYYEKKRQDLLVVSMDCTAPFEICFCTFYGEPPYPQDGYDLNLSPLAGGKEGYLVEAGSPRGEELLGRQKDLIDASEARLGQRDEQRKAAAQTVDRQVAAAGLRDLDTLTEKFRASREPTAPFWIEHANKCVECGACNFICPTCHCFFLQDTEERGGFKRFKNWDSCLYPAFARVAGGANPRQYRVQRLQNRFEKKFDFLPATIGRWGCTGCGRCTEACAGNIDIREVLRDILSS